MEQLRTELSNKLMVEEDKEAPTLYSANVLRNVKYETVSAKYIDRDPMKALEIMACSRY